MVVGINKNSSISSNKKCHIFVTRVSANIEDDCVLQYIKTQPLVSNYNLINVSKKGYKNKYAIIEIDCIDTALTQCFWQTGCYCMPFSTILVVNPGSPGLESSVLVSS